MWLTIILLSSVLATSLLSGILGMAGGMILMAILVSTVSVAAAMMIHGAVQATANGSRAWFLRAHIQWRILPAYLLGAAIALGGFMALALVPQAGVVLIVIGIFPFLARLLSRAAPRLPGLDITHMPTAAACGAAVTAAQLFAGASGPLLDVFYLNSALDRYQVVASKALTQTLGHLIKLGYYGLFIGVVDGVPGWFYLILMATAVVGTRIGTRLLDKLKDDVFRRISGWVILAIAAVCVAKGVLDLLGG
ncbi:MAG: sulfite exporter TauE/SafE family protein [Gammaproteobacteria bacterium]|nr:sulfite exporter TauE/SafE family protein [Gammaproteobacteria bacterium]